jgi:hypothetical protein
MQVHVCVAPKARSVFEARNVIETQMRGEHG